MLAEGLGFAAPLGALAAAGLRCSSSRSAARERLGHDAPTAIVLVGMLALGVILASDVFASGRRRGTLLFGSLLLIEPRDLVLAGAPALALGARSFGRAWLARASTREPRARSGVRAGAFARVLLGARGAGRVAALSALGALLVAALVVVPAATMRLWTNRLPRGRLARSSWWRPRGSPGSGCRWS